MECEILRSPMISYRSLLYSTTILYDYLDDFVSVNCCFLALFSNLVVYKILWEALLYHSDSNP